MPEILLARSDHHLHSEKSDDDPLRAIDSATAALEHEVKSLKAELRGDYRWKRPAWRAKLRAPEVLLFSEPMEAGSGPQTHADMVADLLAAHDRYLLAHARGAVRMAELSEELPVAFELYYPVGLDAGEVAMVCEWPREDVKALLAAVQRRLRDLLRRASDPNVSRAFASSDEKP